MKAVNIRELSDNELDTRLTDLKSELFNLRFQHAVNQLENPKRITAVKKDIARIKTIIRQREISAKAKADAEAKTQTDAQANAKARV